MTPPETDAMTKMSRAESTRALTALAFSWLWVKRECRVMAEEVGVTSLCSRLCAPLDCIFRADAVGCTKKGNQYRIDIIEVKGSRADARREDMSAGKWELLPQGRRLTGWLLVSHDVRDEDIKGLPLAWGLLRASEDGAVVNVMRKAQEHWLPDNEVARDLFFLASRTLGSGLPWMGRTLPECVAKLHAASEAPKCSPEAFVGVDEEPPDPLPAQIPGALPANVKVIDIDQARTFAVRGVVNGETRDNGKLVPIRGIEGAVVGYASVRPVVNGLVFDGSIDYETPERLLLETGQGRLSAELTANGIAIVWPPAEAQS